MEHIEEISCIKDGITGVCRDIKDKKARASIEALEQTVNALAGVDGGHLATDEDVTKLHALLAGQIGEFYEYFEKRCNDTNLNVTANTNNIGNHEQRISTLDNEVAKKLSVVGDTNDEIVCYKSESGLFLTFKTVEGAEAYLCYDRANDKFVINIQKNGLFYNPIQILKNGVTVNGELIANGTVTANNFKFKRVGDIHVGSYNSYIQLEECKTYLVKYVGGNANTIVTGTKLITTLQQGEIDYEFTNTNHYETIDDFLIFSATSKRVRLTSTAVESVESGSYTYVNVEVYEVM